MWENYEASSSSNCSLFDFSFNFNDTIANYSEYDNVNRIFNDSTTNVLAHGQCQYSTDLNYTFSNDDVAKDYATSLGEFVVNQNQTSPNKVKPSKRGRGKGSRGSYKPRSNRARAAANSINTNATNLIFNSDGQFLTPVQQQQQHINFTSGLQTSPLATGYVPHSTYVSSTNNIQKVCINPEILRKYGMEYPNTNDYNVADLNNIYSNLFNSSPGIENTYVNGDYNQQQFMIMNTNCVSDNVSAVNTYQTNTNTDSVAAENNDLESYLNSMGELDQNQKQFTIDNGNSMEQTNDLNVYDAVSNTLDDRYKLENESEKPPATNFGEGSYDDGIDLLTTSSSNMINSNLDLFDSSVSYKMINYI